MKKSSAQAGGNAGIFLTHQPEQMTSKTKSQRRKQAGGGLVDAVINGERVLLATAPAPLEKGIETRIRVALSTAGVLVMKHHVDNRGQKPCVKCGHKDTQRGARTGLGLGVSDLICVVPPHGRFLGIEVKRPGYTPSDVREDQKRWLNVVRRFGGVTGIATSEEEALALVELARGK
jgi:hypothetical protein